MFQNSYQNGTYFQLFDPKISQDKVKNLYKLQNVQGNNKIFDKELKNLAYVFDFNTANSKIVFPREDRKQLYLIQQFLNLQIFLYQEMGWGIEFSVSDHNKTKRRIMLSPNTKIENKPFFVKYPCSHVQEGIWTNLTIDLYSFITAFKGQNYRSMDTLTISGCFKLRRIFTSQQPPVGCMGAVQQAKSINLLPKALCLPAEIQCSNCMISYEEMSMGVEQMYQPTEPSTHNKSNVMSRNLISTPKTQIIRPQKKGYKDEKKFLADTNGPQKKKKKMQKNTSGEGDNSRMTQKAVTSSEKKYEKRQNVGKSQAPKYRSSIQKKKLVKQQQKSKVKNKLNPWRSNKKNDSQTDGGSQLSETKLAGQRKTQSAQTTLFKTKNNLASKFNQSNNKGFQHRSDHYSDSQYVELSQKFSTLTQNRFFKNQHTSQIETVQRDPDQIQQHIELESNQMCQSQNRKQQEIQLIKQLKNNPIDQSISDSLNHITKPKNQKTTPKQSKNSKTNLTNINMMNSYYGFGEKLMNKYMHDVQRPYSPPLCEKQLTEEASQKNQVDDKQVELIYDPVLNCYYDHKTHTYYELKN